MKEQERKPKEFLKEMGIDRTQEWLGKTFKEADQYVEDHAETLSDVSHSYFQQNQPMIAMLVKSLPLPVALSFAKTIRFSLITGYILGVAAGEDKAIAARLKASAIGVTLRKK